MKYAYAFAALAAATPLNKRVSNPASQAVTNTGALGYSASSSNIQDGGAGSDTYKCYNSGNAANYPGESSWMSFEDMFNANKPIMKVGCGNNNFGPNDTDEQIGQIYDAIQAVAETSKVDHRFILATVMQESVGCVWVGTTANGVSNPGLMQSHDGSKYDSSNSAASIKQMIVDGTQGTASGDGLVQLLNQYGNLYKAARAYNSGSIAADGDLNNANGATASYVTDIANRLTGWIHSGQDSDYASAGCS